MIYNNVTTLQVITTCIALNKPVLLRGETGTGKTTIVKTLAENNAKTLTRINITGETCKDDLIGKNTLVDGSIVWQDGILLSAIKAGNWILLDEVNAALPEVLLLLQGLTESNYATRELGRIVLSEKGGEIVTVPPQVRIFATCNPSSYDGTKDFNAATLNRFTVVDIAPLEVDTEEKLLMDRYDTPIARLLVTGAEKARKAQLAGETSVFVSTRALESAAQLHKEGIDVSTAISCAILSQCQNSTDLAVIRSCFDLTILPSKVSFFEQIEKLKKENARLKKEAKTNTDLLAALQQLTSQITAKPITIVANE